MRNLSAAILACILSCGTFASAQWNRTNGPGNFTVTCLAAVRTTLYAGTDSNGVFRSTDEGITWNSASTGLPSMKITRFAAKDTNLYVGTADSGIFFSSLINPTWRPMGQKGRYISALFAGGSRLYSGTVAGAYYRDIADTTWTRIGIFAVYALAGDSVSIFHGVGNGIIRYDITADTNILVLRTATTNTQMGPIWLNGSTLLAGSSGQGFYRSTDYGNVWDYSSSHPLSRATAFAFSGSEIFGSVNGTGVWRSTDNGSNWSAFSTGLQNQRVNALARIDSTLYAGTDTGGVWKYRNPPVALNERFLKDGILTPRSQRGLREDLFFDVLGREWRPRYLGLKNPSSNNLLSPMKKIE